MLTRLTTSQKTAAVWKARIEGIIKGSSVFFNAKEAPGVMIEVACERNGLCDHDQRSFKAYLARWMGWTMLVAPWTRESIMPNLRTSAVAAAKQCGPGRGGCGLRWWQGTNDREAGVGEQMSALEVMQSLLIDQVAGPVGENNGGISKNDPTAGSGGDKVTVELNPITTGDKAAAGILTALILAFLFGGGWWLITGE